MRTERPFWFPDMQGFIAGSVVLMASGALAYRMGHPVVVEDKVLDMMITILYGTAFVAIINFLFGSSRGSDKKDDAILARSAEPSPPASPVSTTTTVTDASTVTKTEPSPAAPAAAPAQP